MNHVRMHPSLIQKTQISMGSKLLGGMHCFWRPCHSKSCTGDVGTKPAGHVSGPTMNLPKLSSTKPSCQTKHAFTYISRLIWYTYCIYIYSSLPVLMYACMHVWMDGCIHTLLSFALLCFALLYTTLHFTILHCIALHYSTLYDSTYHTIPYDIHTHVHTIHTILTKASRHPVPTATACWGEKPPRPRWPLHPAPLWKAATNCDGNVGAPQREVICFGTIHRKLIIIYNII